MRGLSFQELQIIQVCFKKHLMMYELSLSLFLFLSSKVHNGLYKLSILRFSQLDCCTHPLPPSPPQAPKQNSGYQCEMNLGENKQQSRTTNTVNCLRVFLAGGSLTAGHTGWWQRFSQPFEIITFASAKEMTAAAHRIYNSQVETQTPTGFLHARLFEFY